MLCFPETCTEEHPLSEFQPVNSIPKVTIRSGSVPSYKYSFTKNSVACLIKKSPRWTAFEYILYFNYILLVRELIFLFSFSIELSTRTQKLVFCADSEENTLLRLKQVRILSHISISSKFTDNYSKSLLC